MSQSQIGLGSVSLDQTTVSFAGENERWPPRDHFVVAVVASFFCLPLGLLSLFYNVRAKSHISENNRKPAQQAAANSLWLAVAAIALGIGIAVLFIGIVGARASMMCDKSSWVCIERVFGSTD